MEQEHPALAAMRKAIPSVAETEHHRRREEDREITRVLAIVAVTYGVSGLALALAILAAFVL
ncbi:MAG: hypothetical protein KAX54_00060 [Thauera sp.]|nr:hypothetical protein [Thauera sp.]